MNLLNFINLNQNELRLAVAGNLSAAPSSPKAGQIYYDTVLGAAYIYNGTVWVATDASKLVGTIPNTALTTNPLARANHTGTQLASTISNLATTVQAYTLDQFASPVANLSLNSHLINNVLDPVAVQDAATKNYVDTNVQLSTLGIASKPSVQVVSVANQATMTGLPTVDGVTLTSGQRILLVGQTTQTQNGPWIVSAGAWVRPSGDPDGNSDLTLGAFWFVEQGTIYGASQWRLATPTSGSIVVGTTAITITQFGQVISYTAQNGISLTGSVFAGAVVPSGGILASAGGFQLDTTVASRKYATNIGDGSSVTYTVTHNLGTVDVIAQVKDQSGNAYISDYQAGTINTVTLVFGVAPTVNQYRVTVIG
jgi:hypothetical protein